MCVCVCVWYIYKYTHMYTKIQFFSYWPSKCFYWMFCFQPLFQHCIEKHFFLLVYNCFTMFCWFLLYNDMNQLLFLLFSCLVVSNSLQPHELQLASLPCCSLSPRVCSNSCSLSWWCHPTISSSVAPFSCSQSFPVSASFPMSRLLTSGG